MSGSPTISVLMGAYYRRGDTALLERSVRSILSQSVSDLELLICDDGSSPEAARLLERLAEADARLRLIRRGSLFSLPCKLNACLAAADGRYIARMDDDDYSHPLRLEKQLAFLEGHPEYAFCASAARLCHDGKAYGERRYKPAPTKGDLAKYCPFIHPTLLIRRPVIEKIGGYNDKKYTIRCEDYDLYFRLYKKDFFGYNIQEALLDYSESPCDNSKHTPKTRFNEFIVRMRGCAAIGRPLGFFTAFKCLILIFTPKWLYFKLKNARSENNIYEQKDGKA